MAELLNKLKMLIGVEDMEEEEEEYEEEVSVRQQSNVSRMSAGSGMRAAASYGSTSPSPRFETPTYARPASPVQEESKVVRMQGTQKNQKIKLMVVEPDDIKECTKIIDSLKSGKPVIVNLERQENDRARKIFDFLSGAVYALDCGMSKVSNNIFVIAPDNVDIQTSDAKEALASRGISASPWRK